MIVSVVLLRFLPWYEDSRDVEVITEYSFWEDVTVAEMENVLEI